MLTPRALIAALACLAALPAAAAAPDARTAAKDPFSLKVERYQLPSGMTVLLHRDATLPQVVVSTWFNVGSRDERPGRTGFAHLYEHLMFMGTTHVPGSGFDDLMEAEGGHNNASTSTDRTLYYDTGPAHLLPLFLYLEAERLTTLPEAMTGEKVALQREVVRNERRQSYENRPYGGAELLIPAAMYPKGHPYSWPIIGSHGDLLAATTEDVKQFFYDYYAPSNATLMVAGDFNPEEARRLVDHYFGWMPKVPLQKPAAAQPLSRPLVGQIQVEDQVELPRLILVWHAPGLGTQEGVEAELLADVLGKGHGSRLHRALVFDKRLAQEVEVELEHQQLGSLLVVQITAQKGVRPQDLLRATEAELQRLTKEQISDVELERARSQRLTEWAKEIEPLVERAQVIQTMNAAMGDPNGLREEVARLRRLTAGPLQARAAAMGIGEAARRLTITVVPRRQGAQKAAAPAETAKLPPPPPPAAKGAEAARPKLKPPFDLSKRPSVMSQRPFAPPRSARFRVGALEVVLVQRKGAALLDAEVVIPAGSANDGGAGGLASAVVAMLTEGAGERSATEVTDALERLGALVEKRVTQDTTMVAMELMAERYAEGAPILFDLVARPRLGEADWKRVQAERIAEVVRERSEAGYVADQGLTASVFGAGHPYGTPLFGTESTLARLSLADLQRFHARHYRPQGAVLVLAGDVALTQAEADRLAAPFKAWAAALPKDPQEQQEPAGGLALSAPLPAQRRLVLIDRPDAPQSEVRVANLAQSRKSADRAAAEVLNTLLGGTFTSRLNQNLREKRGWAYGAASRFVRFLGTGLFFAKAAVRTDVTADSVGEILKELGRIQAEPVDAAELEKGKRAVVQHLLLLCERVTGLALLFGEIARYGLPQDELSGLLQGARRTTRESLQRVARGALQPDRATVVVVGDRKKIEPALKALHLGPEIEILQPAK